MLCAVTLRRAREYCFAFMGGYSSATFYYISLGAEYTFPTRGLTNSRRESTFPSHTEIMKYIQFYPSTSAILLTLITVAGGWLAILGSACAYMSFAMNRRLNSTYHVTPVSNWARLTGRGT